MPRAWKRSKEGSRPPTEAREESLSPAPPSAEVEDFLVLFLVVGGLFFLLLPPPLEDTRLEVCWKQS